MGRRKADYLWKTVTKLEDGRYRCIYCGHELIGSASRIKAHIFQIPGKGVAICSAAPTSFKNSESLSDRAYYNMREVGNSVDTSVGLVLHDSKGRCNGTDSENSAGQNVMKELEIQAVKLQETERSIQYGKDLTSSEKASDMYKDSADKNSTGHNVREESNSLVVAEITEIRGQYAKELNNFEAQNVGEELESQAVKKRKTEISKQYGKGLTNSGETNVGEDLESQVAKKHKTELSKQYGKELTNSEEQNVREELESQAVKKRKTEISKQYGKELTNSENQNVREELESQAAKKRKREISEQYGKKNVREELEFQAAKKHKKDIELTNPEMVSNMDELLDQWVLVDPTEIEISCQQLAKQRGGELINPDQILLIDRMFGQNFECYIERIKQLLLDENVFNIGLVGMGGVGKTHLATYIFDQIQKGLGSFDHVFWVTVSQNSDIYKLQNDIARRVSLDLGNEDDERMRAGRLSLAWESKGKFVLILDDVWKGMDLETIGITPKVNGTKLILTSRSGDVCLKMGCTRSSIIEVEPLPKEASWELCLLYLGLPKGCPLDVIEIARSVVLELQGLPLAVKTMAKCMKGIMDVHTWRHALYQLRNSSFLEDEMDTVFRVLRLSYDNLNEKMRKCLLYCALYPEDFPIKRREVIMKFADAGLIDLGRSLGDIFDEGHCILDKLVANYLLIDCGMRHWSGDRCVKMHDLIRFMACRIFEESPLYMVKSGRGLTRIPHVKQWTVDLEKVSLMQNTIIEIPQNVSPCCPRMSTLIISDNPLKYIPDCFFIQMHTLVSLDLSYTDIKILPQSVSELKSLVSLQLNGCSRLENIPTLGELQALARLELSFTAIHYIPRGLERLVNLKWMDLSENRKLESVGGSVLSNLTGLEFLNLFVNLVRVKVEDLKKMSCLESFEGSFYDHEHFNEFVSSLNLGRGLGNYILHLGIGYPDKLNFFGCGRSVGFGDCKDNFHLLPNGVEAMSVSENYQWLSLCGVLSFERSSTLRLFIIDHCPQLETLFCRSGSCSFCNSLPCLETLKLNHLDKLAVIWKEKKDVALPWLSGYTFSHLTNIYVCRCDQLRALLTPSLVAQLHNLVKIDVRSCRQLEEIFSVASTEEGVEYSNNAEGIGNKSFWGNHTDDFTISHSKLEELALIGLQQLKYVCKWVMDCCSFRKLTVVNCPNMRSFPSIMSNSAVQVITDLD